MLKHELKKIAEFLTELSEMQGNAGCNDYIMENTNENWNLVQRAQRWNSKNSEEWSERPPLEEKICTYDFLIVGYLKHLCEIESSQGSRN